ncbi:hypothetical protein [Flavobacterium agrisoli]|uniref:PepSY-like beta-lactamase-inhibitor n=1 Tax=Flavobacterium agrisoli TaxID=2793066 RepID=A0A934PNP4_9FLAO|nr:hypothetical protein [Flavobacterium agrisoli]MBK0369831.1 hypothetical protein [Flavobacterium agrisoli]
MKKLILSAAIVLGGLTTTVATAHNVNPIVKSVSVADEYTEIKLEELPAAVTEALKKAYPDAVVTKAYVNEKKEYKLDVKVGDKEGNLFADANGNWIQK